MRQITHPEPKLQAEIENSPLLRGLLTRKSIAQFEPHGPVPDEWALDALGRLFDRTSLKPSDVSWHKGAWVVGFGRKGGGDEMRLKCGWHKKFGLVFFLFSDYEDGDDEEMVGRLRATIEGKNGWDLEGGALAFNRFGDAIIGFNIDSLEIL